MMRKRILTIALAVTLPQLAWSQDDAKTLLQQALFAEEAEQKLDKAAENYEKVIANYKSQRDYAVTALYRLAEVRRKQDRPKEAVAHYQRILTDFPKAEPQARLSRENLEAMGISVAEAGVAAKPIDPEEEKLLRRLMMIRENSPDKVWELTKDYGDTHEWLRKSPLIVASSKGWSNIVSTLLNHAKETSHDLSAELSRAIKIAVRNGHRDIASKLIAHGAKIEDASHVLAQAIANHDDELANWLIDKGVDINSIGSAMLGKVNVPMSPLAAAIRADNKPWVDRLLELGADVNQVSTGDLQISALSIACWKGHTLLVKKLLARGADPDAADKFNSNYGSIAQIRQPPVQSSGWTPLHYGAGNPEIVTALLDAGAKTSSADTYGITPLHCASLSPNRQSIKPLLEAGAAPGTLAKFPAINKTAPTIGITPIMLASLSSDSERALDCIELLIGKGADIHAKNENGTDVFEFCTMPTTATALARRYLYPKVTKADAVTLTFPACNAILEFASAPEDGQQSGPPSLAQVLMNLGSRHARHPGGLDSSWENFDWQRPTLWRRGESGKFTQQKIDIPGGGELPELKFGDIIEIGSAEHEKYPGYKNSDSAQRLSVALGSSSVQRITLAIPISLRFALEASNTAEITIQFPDEAPQKLQLRGGIVASNPFGDFASLHYDLLRESFRSKAGKPIAEFEIIPRTESENSVKNRERPVDGDTFKVTQLSDFGQRHHTIQLVEPSTQTQLYSVGVPRSQRSLPEKPPTPAPAPAMKATASKATPNKAIAKARTRRRSVILPPSNSVPNKPATRSRSATPTTDKLEGCSHFPTLFQFLTSAYTPLPIGKISPSTAGLREEYNTLGYAFRWKKEGQPVPSENEIRRALGACARQSAMFQTTMPHPDFAIIRIRRLPEKIGPDEIIEVPLGKLIAECTADTPADVCRKNDIELMAGDIVELPALHDQLDQPWNGFDAATARFFTKALSYDFKLTPKSGGLPIGVTRKWRSPRFYETDAGLIGIVNTQDAVHPDPRHRYPSHHFDLLDLPGFQLQNRWLRAGASVGADALRNPGNLPSRRASSYRTSQHPAAPVRGRVMLPGNQ